MLHSLYTLAIRLYTAGIHAAAIFHKKAAQWVAGRKPGQPSAIPPPASSSACTLWLHAASLGEFEQGRPLLEAVRQRHPDWRILLTFFSPSGYEMRKHYPHADWVGYLPPDLPISVRAFLDEAQPDVAVFVKYEFWANYLFALRERGTPTLLVSALFRPEQPFFRWYGGLWRQMLSAYTHLFVQDHASAALLRSIGRDNVTVAGDTRVDRVLQIAQQAAPDATVADFAGQPGRFVLVVGSSWEADERLIAAALSLWPGAAHLRLIIAPHDPSEANVRRIEGLFPAALRYSQAKKTEVATASNCLIIDNVGLLNTLYRYGTAAYIGGGHGKGIHNTLEPAAWGLPVAFGPRYEKFEEARQFVARGGGFVIRHPADLAGWLEQMQDTSVRQRASRAVLDYLAQSRGATDQVLAFIESELPACTTSTGGQ